MYIYREREVEDNAVENKERWPVRSLVKTKLSENVKFSWEYTGEYMQRIRTRPRIANL